MKVTYWGHFLLFCLLLSFTPFSSWASGILQGYVQDSSGNPIAGALISIEAGTGVRSNEDGSYSMHHLAGTFTVTASAHGYEDSSLSHTLPDSSTSLDFHLTPRFSVQSIYPNLQEMGETLEVTVRGHNFDNDTRIARIPDSGNRSSIIGNHPVTGYTKDVIVAGTTAYIANYEDGFSLVDISIPEKPTLIGNYSTDVDPDPSHLEIATGLAVKNDMLYVANRCNFLIYDLGDLSTPLFQYPTTTAESVTVVNQIAYVSDYDEGLLIFDISNPVSPQYLTTFATAGYVNRVQVIGDLAYVAVSDVPVPAPVYHKPGLQILDVSNPNAPSSMSVTTFPGEYGAHDVVIHNDGMAYMANSEYGLAMIDISDPENPALINNLHRLNTPDSAQELLIKDNRLYVADSEGLLVMDISDPMEIFPVDYIATPGSAFGVAVQDDLIYVADGSAGLQIVAIPQLDSETPWVGMFTRHHIGAIEKVDNYLYLADDIAGLQVVDITDPFSPVIIGGFAIDTAVDVAVQGDYAYLVNYLKGLYILNISTPASPTEIMSFHYPAVNMRSVSVSTDRAFVALGNFGFIIYDITDPTIADSVKDSDGLGLVDSSHVLSYADELFVADGAGGFKGFWLRGDPIELSLDFSIDTGGDTQWVTVSDDKAYVTDAIGGLSIFDISGANIWNPVLLGSLPLEGYSRKVTVNDTVAYISKDPWQTLPGEGSMHAVDVSDPAQPRLLGSVDIMGTATDVVLDSSSGLAFVAAGSGGLSVIPQVVAASGVSVENDNEVKGTLAGAPMAGNYSIRLFNETEDDTLTAGITYTNEINLLSSKAIIVAGGGPEASGEIWEETKAYANYAYDNLLYQGYRHEDIYYLTDETGAVGRDLGATRENLRQGIVSWAKNGATDSDLLIYLVDHGDLEAFQVRGGTTEELITAQDLDGWLDDLQSTLSGKIILVYDACKSGSFIAHMSPDTGKTRITLTSSSSDQVSYFLDRHHSFSHHFWSTFTGKSGDKAILSDAWQRAAETMSSYQTAQLDANSNGVANEANDFSALQGYEGTIYALRRQYESQNHSKPVVGVVTPDTTLSNDFVSSELWARNIFDVDGDAIVRVWAEIIPPDFNPQTGGLTVKTIPTLELLDLDNDGIYTGSYPDFTIHGTYIITYYAQDSSGIYSLPQRSLVIQPAGNSQPASDAYEPDNTANEASIIVLSSPTPQNHTFHTDGDTDWVQFYGISGQVYNVKAANPSPICDPMIELYDIDTTRLLGSSDSAGSGKTEILSGWTCPADGIYSVRISNSSNHFGANVSYELKVYNPTAFSLPGYVSGTVSSDGTGIGGVILTTSSGSALSTGDGSYIMSLEPGGHTVSLSKAGYHDTSFSVSITSSATSQQNISLTRDNTSPAISGTPSPTTLRTNERFTFTPTVTDPDAGETFSFSISGQPSWANFSKSTGTLSGIPDYTAIGSHGPISISVSDSFAATDALAPFTLTVIEGDNLAPVITGNPSSKISASASFSFTPAVSDPNGDPVTFAITGQPGWTSFNSETGHLYGTPGTANIGSHGPVSITATDSLGASNNLSFTLTVLSNEEMDKLGTLPAIFYILLQSTTDDQ